jgi:hypothetical protein
LTGVTGPRVKVSLSGEEKLQSLSIKSDWGWEGRTDYDPATGQPRRVELKVEGKTASAAYDRGRPLRVRQFDGGEFVLTYPDRPDAPPTRMSTPNGLSLDFKYDEKERLRQTGFGRACWVEYVFDAQDRLAGLKYTPR